MKSYGEVYGEEDSNLIYRTACVSVVQKPGPSRSQLTNQLVSVLCSHLYPPSRMQSTMGSNRTKLVAWARSVTSTTNKYTPDVNAYCQAKVRMLGKRVYRRGFFNNLDEADEDDMRLDKIRKIYLHQRKVAAIEDFDRHEQEMKRKANDIELEQKWAPQMKALRMEALQRWANKIKAM